MFKVSWYRFNFEKKMQCKCSYWGKRGGKKRVLGVRRGTTLHTAVSVLRTSGAPDLMSVSHSNQRRRVWPRTKRGGSEVKRCRGRLPALLVFLDRSQQVFRKGKRRGRKRRTHKCTECEEIKPGLDWLGYLKKKKKKTADGLLRKLCVRLHNFTAQLVWRSPLDKNK